MISEINKRLQTTINIELYEALEEFCNDYSATKSEIVAELLENYLSKEGYYGS